MSHSIRFLGFAILAWAAVRAVTLGVIPGTQALSVDLGTTRPAGPRLPPIQPTVLPPIEPVVPRYQQFAPPMGYGPQGGFPPYGPYPAQPAAYAPFPIYVPVPAATSRSSPPQIIYVERDPPGPREVHVHGASYPSSEAPQKLALAEPVPARQSTPSFGDPRVPRGFDRLQLSSWATMRDESGSQSLASGGTLGGSQAGARLLWRYNPHLAASLRASAPINSQSGGEAALGVRYQPFMSIPVAATLERRQAFGGDGGGQNAFALFAEGGVYGRPMPWDATLDGYFQGGVVDFNDPDWFIYGQAAVTRPVWRNLSAGFGMWGGAQPGLSRFDLGPRASLRVGARMRVHLDYRLKLVGNAKPGSGGVVTLAGDF